MSYVDFFLNSESNIVQLECLEISHPNFTKTYYVVRNAIAGVTVTHEDASSHAYEYYPLAIVPTGASDDLDQTLHISLGDLGAILPLELDAIRAANGFDTKPIIMYRTYRSDDLTQPLSGPFKFEVVSLPFNKDGVSFEATAPKLNLSSTGERYTMDRFPMLKGFV